MKTIKILSLLLLPFVLFAQATIFDLPNRTNIWIEEGSNSKTFSVSDWSQNALLKDMTIISNEVTISTTQYTDGLQVLVNDIPSSYPRLDDMLPRLSLVGFDPANALLGDSLDTPSLTISPDGGTFDDTIEVTMRLNAPGDFVDDVNYSIDGGGYQTKSLGRDGNNSVVFYLSTKGDHTVRYYLKSEGLGSVRTAHFTLTNTNAKRDSDGDGIPDSVEAELGFDPFSNIIPDSNQNGWNDFDEYVRGYDLTDSDGDGWTDWDETQLRMTDPLNPYPCADLPAKPSAATLYSVEYILTEDEAIVEADKIQRLSLVDLRSNIKYDSTVLLDDTQLTEDNVTLRLCVMTQVDYKNILDAGERPNIRTTADIPSIARIREIDALTSKNTSVKKMWLDARDPLTLNSYLESTNFKSLPEDFDAEAFTNSYVNYLKANLLVSKDFNFSTESSIYVGFTEAAFKSRSENNGMVVLGNPDFVLPIEMYDNTLKALNESNRSANDLYQDLKNLSTTSDLYSDAEKAMVKEDDNTTEERLARFLQDTENEKLMYKFSLMTLVSYKVAESYPSVYELDEDSDKDELLNKDEVLPPLDYTDPLNADSDNDGVPDNEDSCPVDENDECMNDEVALADSDGDGVKDSVDNCPFDANPDQTSTLVDGIGDVCAKKGIVIVTPRTNITLQVGDLFTFEAFVTIEQGETITWMVDKDEVAANVLNYTQTFEGSGTYRVCTFLGKADEENMSCVNITVLPRNLSRDVNIYANDISEGNEGEKNLLVEVVLSEPAVTEVTYAYKTGDNTATEGSDYTKVEGSLIFREGEIRQYLRIPILGDTDFEEDETFNLYIGKEYKITLHILNDDEGIIVPDPVLQIEILDTADTNEDGIPEVLEGNVNKTVTFLFALSKPAEKEATLHYTTDIVEIVPIPDPDETVYPEYHSMIENITGDFIFAIGEQFKEKNVTIIGDVVNESNKTFTLRVTDPVNMKLYNLPEGVIIENPDQKDTMLMIVDNDPLPMVSFERSTYNTMEGKQVDIKLMLSSKSYQTVEVNLTIDEESTATEMDDYTLSTKHMVIPASKPDTNNLSSTVTLSALEDADEADVGENVTLHLESANNAIISNDASTTVITIGNESSSNTMAPIIYLLLF